MASGSDASFYAGILISAFSLAEALTGMFWGSLSDRLGRKPVLLFGCFGTMLSLLLVGFAPNFWVALAGRALGGALNGNIGVIQTMVGELVKRPEHERKSHGTPHLKPCANIFYSPGIRHHAFCLVNRNYNWASYWRSPCKTFGGFPLSFPPERSLWAFPLPFAQPCLFCYASTEHHW